MIGTTFMMTQHQMATLTAHAASMVISQMTGTVQQARTTKTVTKTSLVVAVMMTENQLTKVSKMTAKNEAAHAITKMAKIKVMTSGQTMAANALATANDSAKS